MNHLDLFSGIGGFALGLESTGHYRTVAFCEIEKFPRRVLAKHWPNVPCYQDVRDVGANRLAADGITGVDILTGGFPCQDISLAGNRAGLSGARSGLWTELFRVISEVRPRWAIVENVPGLRTLGTDSLLADLARADYAAWPLVVGAVHAGAPHRRQRVWIVANAIDGRNGWGKQQPKGSKESRQLLEHAAHAQRQELRPEQRWSKSRRPREAESGDDGEGRDAPHPDSSRRSIQGIPVQPGKQGQAGADAPGRRRRRQLTSEWAWDGAPEPVLRGVDDGLPCGMDRRQRLTALGNAVVPQIVANIGRAIAQVDAWRASA